MACQEHPRLQRVKPEREGCPQSPVTGLCLPVCTCQDPRYGTKDARLGRARDCESTPIQTWNSGGVGIQEESYGGDRSPGFDRLLGKPQVRNHRHWFPAPLTPRLEKSQRGGRWPYSAELCPPCARRWWWRLANPGGPGLRPGGGCRACVVEAPAWPGRAHPWRPHAWDTQGSPHPRKAQSAAFRVSGRPQQS